MLLWFLGLPQSAGRRGRVIFGFSDFRRAEKGNPRSVGRPSLGQGFRSPLAGSPGGVTLPDWMISYSNSDLSSPDCRIMEARVPGLRSLWMGTGTVRVVSPVRICMIRWLPRCRTSRKPWDSSRRHISTPEKCLRGGILGFKLGDPGFLAEAALELGR